MIDIKVKGGESIMTNFQSNLPHNMSNLNTSNKHYSKIYNPNDLAMGQLAEDLVRNIFNINGIPVNPHAIGDKGCDGIFTYNGKLGCYEVNHWSNYYFHDDRAESIDENLVNGLEDVNGNYIKHENIKYKFHFCFGALRTKWQLQQAKTKNIIVIYFKGLPSKEELWAKIASIIENPFLKFYSVKVIGDYHLQNNCDVCVRDSNNNLDNGSIDSNNHTKTDTAHKIQHNISNKISNVAYVIAHNRMKLSRFREDIGDFIRSDCK
jgi:hypothetical protein